MMPSKYVFAATAGLSLCMLIPSVGQAQSSGSAQALPEDHKNLEQAYQQLQNDKANSDAATLAADQDNITKAQTKLQVDEQQSARDALANDQRVLDQTMAQMLKDQTDNTAAVQLDQNNILAVKKALEADRQRVVIADQLEISQDQQSLQNYNLQLQQDQRENAGAIEDDENNIKSMTKVLQAAQLKLQIDHDSQDIAGTK